MTLRIFKEITCMSVDTPLTGVKVQPIPLQNGTETRVIAIQKGDQPPRAVVVMQIDGVNVPFYCSTGAGGKDVPAGKWYPIFGMGSQGWFNKGKDPDILRYYGSPRLQQVSEYLDKQIGDIRNQPVFSNVPRVLEMDDKALSVINHDMTPIGLSEVKNAGPDYFINQAQKIEIAGAQDRLQKYQFDSARNASNGDFFTINVNATSEEGKQLIADLEKSGFKPKIEARSGYGQYPVINLVGEDANVYRDHKFSEPPALVAINSQQASLLEKCTKNAESLLQQADKAFGKWIDGSYTLDIHPNSPLGKEVTAALDRLGYHNSAPVGVDGATNSSIIISGAEAERLFKDQGFKAPMQQVHGVSPHPQGGETPRNAHSTTARFNATAEKPKSMHGPAGVLLGAVMGGVSAAMDHGDIADGIAVGAIGSTAVGSVGLSLAEGKIHEATLSTIENTLPYLGPTAAAAAFVGGELYRSVSYVLDDHSDPTKSVNLGVLGSFGSWMGIKVYDLTHPEENPQDTPQAPRRPDTSPPIGSVM